MSDEKTDLEILLERRAMQQPATPEGRAFRAILANSLKIQQLVTSGMHAASRHSARLGMDAILAAATDEESRRFVEQALQMGNSIYDQFATVDPPTIHDEPMVEEPDDDA